MPQKIIKKVRQSYTFKEKVIVVRYALREGNLRATVKFDLDKTQVGCWVTKLKDKLDEVEHSKSCRLKGGGRKSFFPDEEIQLNRWISEMRSAALAVTYNSLKFEMLRIVSETASKSNDLGKRQLASNFKASSMWLKHFLKRHNLALRRKTKIAQKMPSDLEQQLLNFQQYVIRLRLKKNYPLSNIANMDETPVWFDIAGDLTIEQIGAKTVHIRTTGNEKNRFTVVLMCFADGQKLPPTVIFKGQRWAKTKGSPPPGVIVLFHEKGWIDEPGMLSWANNYIEDRPGGQKNEPSLLVYDSFKAHLTDTVKAKLQENNNDLVVIPGGLTSVCQPLNVSINHPFKVELRNHWHKWMTSGGSGKTKKGNLKRAELRTVCEWVLAAWAKINPEIIHRAFRKCSISNAMDGLENSEIYYDEILDNKTDEANENNSDMDSSDSGENEEDFEDKENLDATIKENEDVLLFTID